MICFVAALRREVAPMIEKYAKKEIRFGFASCYECEMEGKPFLMMVSGMGKCFAAMSIAALKASERYPLDCVINVGVGGSVKPNQAGLLSCLLGEKYIQHDMDSSPLGDPKAMISGINMVELPSSEELLHKVASICAELGVPCSKGLICSGDQFIVGQAKDDIIHAFPETVSVDMESAAYAQAAFVNNVPFVAARFISDTGHAGEYETYFGDCVNRIESLVERFVKDNA